MTLAAYSGNLDIIAMLLQHNSLDYYCKTTFIPPICAATIAGQERVVQWFCDTYQDPQPECLPKTIEGQKLEHLTITSVTLFISSSFPFNVVLFLTFPGVTPLMMAVIYDQPQIYMHLLQKFTNAHQLTNALDFTASDYKQFF